MRKPMTRRTIPNITRPMLPQPPRGPSRAAVRDERGAASLWVVLVISVAFTALLGLVLDGGRVIDARLTASRAAAQAARTGADQLSQSSIRSGGNAVASQAAASTARGYLGAAGLTGSVRIDGATVTVSVHGTSRPTILGIFGVNSFSIDETESARGIQGDG